MNPISQKLRKWKRKSATKCDWFSPDPILYPFCDNPFSSICIILRRWKWNLFDVGNYIFFNVNKNKTNVPLGLAASLGVWWWSSSLGATVDFCFANVDIVNGFNTRTCRENKSFTVAIKLKRGLPALWIITVGIRFVVLCVSVCTRRSRFSV